MGTNQMINPCDKQCVKNGFDFEKLYQGFINIENKIIQQNNLYAEHLSISTKIYEKPQKEHYRIKDIETDLIYAKIDFTSKAIQKILMDLGGIDEKFLLKYEDFKHIENNQRINGFVLLNMELIEMKSANSDTAIKQSEKTINCFWLVLDYVDGVVDGDGNVIADVLKSISITLPISYFDIHPIIPKQVLDIVYNAFGDDISGGGERETKLGCGTREEVIAFNKKLSEACESYSRCLI